MFLYVRLEWWNSKYKKRFYLIIEQSEFLNTQKLKVTVGKEDKKLKLFFYAS